MAIELLDYQLIIDYLDVQVSALKNVSGAAALAAASADLKQTPAAFVVPMSDRPTPNRTGTMAVQQNNTTRFAVILAVQNLRDARGQKAQDDLRTLRNNILTTLHGWQPADAFDPIEYGGGRMLQLTNQVLWWQDEFLTAHAMRSI